jgi:hypothetical protein
MRRGGSLAVGCVGPAKSIARGQRSLCEARPPAATAARLAAGCCLELWGQCFCTGSTRVMVNCSPHARL